MFRRRASAALALLAAGCIAHMPASDDAEQNTDGVNEEGDESDDTGQETPETPAPETPAPETEDVPARPFVCADSKSPMFASQTELGLRISGDFTRLNSATSDEESTSEARIEFDDGSAATTATLRVRGNSRKACGFRPFFLKFAAKQKDNAFAKLGKSVKFTTHCGDREGMPAILKAGSLAEYEERLRLEHAIYQVLDQLGIPSLKTRLVQLTYHDTATGTEERHLAMVREPEDETAERCGMVERDDDTEPSPVPLTESPYGELLTALVNEFVIQYDRKNEFRIEDWTRGLVYTVAYDFDLVGVIREDYGPNDGRTLEQNLARFATFLRDNQSEALKDELTRILARASAMRSVPSQVGISEASQARLTRWLDGFLDAMAQVAACTGSDRPEEDACFVADDHGDGPNEATPLTEGVTPVSLAPIADVDTFRATLEAGSLYTFTGCATFPCLSLSLLDGQGNTLAEDSTLSHLAETNGPVFVRASLGQGLLAVPAGSLIFYRDDHRATLSGATPLVAGTAVAGRWEIQNFGDDDWFAFEASPGATLHVSATNAFGFARVAPRDSLDSEEVLDLQEGDNDLSALILGPGEHVLKLLHTDVGAYEVVLGP